MAFYSGELVFLIKDMEFTSKGDLLEKLKKIRGEIKHYPEEESKQLRPIFKVALQQAYNTSEWELMRFKERCDFRRKHGEQKRENDNSGD